MVAVEIEPDQLQRYRVAELIALDWNVGDIDRTPPARARMGAGRQAQHHRAPDLVVVAGQGHAVLSDGTNGESRTRQDQHRPGHAEALQHPARLRHALVDGRVSRVQQRLQRSIGQRGTQPKLAELAHRQAHRENSRSMVPDLALPAPVTTTLRVPKMGGEA